MPLKKPTVKKLKSKADTLFSKAIRLRDSVDGVGVCITCERKLSITSAHAGHFMSRRYSGTRFDEENVNLQCAGCNMFGNGEQYKYGIAIDLKYGSGTAKKLYKKAHAHHKLTVQELEEIINDAKEEIKFYEGLLE